MLFIFYDPLYFQNAEWFFPNKGRIKNYVRKVRNIFANSLKSVPKQRRYIAFYLHSQLSATGQLAKGAKCVRLSNFNKVSKSAKGAQIGNTNWN